MASVAIIGTRGYPSYYGGFETAVRKLAPFLVDAGWDVTVYGRPGAVRASDPALDVRVTSVETRGLESRSLSTLSFGLTASGHAIRFRPDVALVMNVANGYWLPFLRRAGIPTLVNVDGIEWERAKWGALAKSVFRTGAKLTAKYGTCLVYDSREIAARWDADYGVGGVFIPYGGDLLQDELPLEEGLSHRAYVLMVARFVPENSVPEFFQAAEVISEHADVVIVGSSGYGGELDEAAKDLASRRERVHWLGHISDDRRLNALWQHAGVYFHGHSVGGTNPALVQAMACGAPIVARDTAFTREVLGEKGRFVDPSPNRMSEVILGLLHDRKEMDNQAEEARLRARASYAWADVNAAYERALRALIHGHDG